MTLKIALDPGFGNTKVCINGATTILQSAVAKPRNIGSAAIGMKRHKAASTVTLAGTDYVAGEGAWFLGEPLGGLAYGAIAGQPRRVLFYAALSALLVAGYYQAELVVGLPVPLLANQAEAATVMAELRESYKTTHEWTCNGLAYTLEVNRLSVLAQPVGAYADWLLTDQLRIRKGAGRSEVAILDIGMNTLDLYVVQGGRVVERFIGGERVGVRRLLAALNGHGQDLEELDADLRAGLLKPSDHELHTWLQSILNQVERTWPELKRFDAVIPAGGGALVLGDLLYNALLDRGAVVSWPDNPITTNAAGLWKWASYQRA